MCDNWQVQSICWCALSKIVSLFVPCLSVFILIWRGFKENGSRQEKKQTAGILVLDPLLEGEIVRRKAGQCNYHKRHCRHNIGVFWGPSTPSTPPNNISACSGGCRPSVWRIGAECKASCGALGDHSCRPAAMVRYGCVGHCWLLEANVRSTYCRNSIYCLRKYFFLFLPRTHTILDIWPGS